MTFLFNPARCCCGCTVFEDLFERADSSDLGSDWDQVAGTWSIASGSLETASTNAICRAIPAHADSEIIANAWLQIPGEGDRARLIVGYIDANNYHFVELCRSTTFGFLRVGQRSSGSDSILFTTSINLSDALYLLKACYDGKVLRGTVSDIGEHVLAEVSHTATVTAAPVAIGTGSAVSSTITFNSFSLDRHQGEDPDADCPTCNFAVTACCGSISSESQAILDLTGFSLSNGTCDRCGELAAEIILPFTGVSGDAEWSFDLSDWCCCVCEPLQGPAYDCGNNRLDLSIHVRMTDYTETDCRIVVEITLQRLCSGPDLLCSFLYWRGEGFFGHELGCSGITVDIDVVDSSLGSPAVCSGTLPSTVTVTLPV